jgi:hypothetical protein
MTKFVLSKDVPAELSSYELVINPPNLLEEVVNCWNHRPANGLTGTNWLRQIANEITRWDKSFNPYRHCIPSDYQGIQFSTPEEVASIVLRMVNDSYPGLNDAWVEHCVKMKPPFTKLIWFTGDFKQTNSLSNNFIDRIDFSEVEEYMGRHAKKVSPKISTSKPVEEVESPVVSEETTFEAIEVKEAPKPSAKSKQK